MNALKISTNSWHYRLAKFGSLTGYVSDDTNMCDYISKMLRGIYLMVCCAVGMAMLGAVLSEMILSPIFALLYGVEMFSQMAIVAWIFTLGASIVVAGIASWDRIHARVESTSFVPEAFKSIAGKYCKKLEFHD